MATHPNNQTGNLPLADAEATMPRVPAASLALLLGNRLQALARDIGFMHSVVPAVPASSMRFYQQRVAALAPRQMHTVDTPDSQNDVPVERELEEDLARFPASTLDGARRQSLSRALGMDLPVVRIHHHHYAQQLTRTMQADALSIGRDVLLRSPQVIKGPQGSALLGHELTHAAQEQTRPQLRQPTAAEERVREITAITHERLLLGAVPQSRQTVAAPSPVNLSAHPTRKQTINTKPVRAASQDRQIGRVSAAPVATAELDANQMRQIQDNVYRDLMMRVREEFERGS